MSSCQYPSLLLLIPTSLYIQRSKWFNRFSYPNLDTSTVQLSVSWRWTQLVGSPLVTRGSSERRGNRRASWSPVHKVLFEHRVLREGSCGQFRVNQLLFIGLGYLVQIDTDAWGRRRRIAGWSWLWDQDFYRSIVSQPIVRDRYQKRNSHTNHGNSNINPG